MANEPTGKPADNFAAVAPHYMRMFMADFSASDLDAAAVFGNAGYESLGFTKLQEMEPTVKGSKGGFGWFQWTGPRRRAFEDYCRRNKLDITSPDANYAFLFVELGSTEKGALPKLKAAKSLDTKTVAFENAFERAGVKAYAKRKAWAKFALSALRASPALEQPDTVTVTTPVGKPTAIEQPAPQGFGRLIAVIVAILVAIGTGVAHFFGS